MRLVQLHETSLSGTTFKDVVTKRYIENIANGIYWDEDAHKKMIATDVDTISEIIDEYPELLPDHLQDLEYEEIIRHPDLRIVVVNWAKIRFAHVVKKLAKIPKRNGKIVINRIMNVQDDWIDRVARRGEARLGVFWTYDYAKWDYPSSPWAKENAGAEIIIRALIAPSAVNWVDTIRANMDYHSGDDEHEMRLFPRTPIEVTSVRYRWDDRLITKLRGVRFTA